MPKITQMGAISPEEAKRTESRKKVDIRYIFRRLWKYLAKHKPKDSNSTLEMWKIREQAKMHAEEVIYGEIVYQYH